MQLTTDEIDKLIKEIDYADNDKINYSEFIAATIDV
jgi:Ca2+-binding EF-hand superfamily protein|tara:strand:- start:120 stop:227 length:108 start_codon:yes stop_codon:yes gene_type:complete